MNKRLAILVGLLVLAAIVVAAFYYHTLRRNTQAVVPFSVQNHELNPTQLPQGFYKDLPVEEGSEVLQNYDTSISDGRKQSTRVATTSKSLADAVKLYEDFYVRKGWTDIKTPNTNPDKLDALLRRNNDVIEISASKGVNGQPNTVQLMLTEVKK